MDFCIYQNTEHKNGLILLRRGKFISYKEYLGVVSKWAYTSYERIVVNLNQLI